MVNIHNIMEEQVLSHVNALYDQVKAKKSAWLECDCENCRLDTASYVLNRIPPHYVVSGRGATHNVNFLNENTQISADIDKLAIEGMRLVNNAKRSYHKEGRNNPTIVPDSNQPAFNFPTFYGNVFDGTTFEPLADARVLLKVDDEIAEMMDVTWPNPCVTYKATKGIYTFWLTPIIAQTEGIRRKFNFTVEVNAYGYAETKYSFTVPLTSELLDRRELNSTYSLKIQDIFLFREDEENDL